MKEFIKDFLNYFNKESQMKLYKFFIQYEKKKQKNSINIAISDDFKDKNENETNNIENKNRSRMFSPEIKRNKENDSI